MTSLYLLRHGEAERSNPEIRGDRARRLTAQGVQNIQRLAEDSFSQRGLIERIYHSPYPRALATAAIIAKTSGAMLVAMDELIPSGSAERVVDELAGIERPCLLVSHLPLVAEVAALILGGSYPTFYQGTCLHIRLTDTYRVKGELVTTIHPAVNAE